MRIEKSFLFVCMGLVSLAACSPSAPGEVAWVANGGDEVTTGISSSQMEDGWSVQFSQYLVSLGPMQLSRDNESTSIDSQYVVDLMEGRVNVARLPNVKPARWNVEFVVAPPKADTKIVGKVTNSLRDFMQEKGFSVWVKGQGVKSGVGVVSFDLGFPVAVRMSDCTNGVDGTSGIVVSENRDVDAEMSFHAEHLFYDRLGSHRDVKLRFEAIAAAAGTDKFVTMDELVTQDILNLKGMNGDALKDGAGNPVLYAPGSYPVRNLQEFLLQSVLDQAHLNGGGLCSISKM